MDWRCLVVLAVAAIAQGQNTCLTSEEEPYLHFATKTAYIFANQGHSTNKAQDVFGCKPIAIWLLNRHGSHNPEAFEIPDLQKLIHLKNNVISNYKNGNFRNLNQRMCISDVNLLDRWEWNPRQNISFAGDLTSDGYISTTQLAQAWKQRYPGLLTDNRHDYLFKFVNDQRTSTTFRAFTEGLFRAQAEEIDVPRENDEKLLRPYKFCPSWTRNVEENNDTMSQLYIFESKREYREMISNISQRLGFNYDVDKESVKRMYQMCRYNKAWNVAQISPWCSPFTREDLKRLEYAEDLKMYYKYGYGNTINQKLGCTPIKDMINFFKNHVEHDVPQQPRAMVHFTEAAMLLMTASSLGARHDSAPLTGDNYHTSTVQARKWSTSVMTPFNANIAAVLYKCTTNGNFQIKEQYQVLFLENEREMNIDGCHVGLCEWSKVKDKYEVIANRCDLQFCNGATKTNGVLAISIALVGYFTRFALF